MANRNWTVTANRSMIDKITKRRMVHLLANRGFGTGMIVDITGMSRTGVKRWKKRGQVRKFVVKHNWYEHKQ